MKKRHGRRGRIACFNNTACEQRVICVWMKITTRHSIPSQMPMQMIQWWTSADVHHVVPCYPYFFLWFSVEKFFSYFFFFFSLLFLFTLDLSRREIAFDLSRYVEKLFSTIVIYFTTNDIRNVCWICLSDFDLWKLKIVNSYIITRNKIKIVQRLIFILSLIFLQPRSFLLSEFYSLENEV